MEKINRRVVAAVASVALALGIFAAAPLSAEAKTNYKVTKSIGVVSVSFDSGELSFSAAVNGV